MNHIGHFLLTMLLFDKVRAAPEGRIVVLSSGAHSWGTNKIRWDDMNHETSYDPMAAYSMSKLANVYFTRHLGSIIDEKGHDNVKVVSLDPGVVRTELPRYYFTGWKFCLALFVQPLFILCSKPVWYGA